MVETSSPGSVDLLVLAAYAPELSAMRRILGDHLYGNISGVVVACKAVGVGLPNATAGAVTRLMQLRPRAVVAVGTGGVYPGTALSLDEVVVGRRVHLVDPMEVEQRGLMPDPMSRTLDCSQMIALGLAQGRVATADIATTLVHAVDDNLAARVGQSTGCAIESLECFGIANACALQNVPFACVIGAAYQVGAAGRDQWRSHHKPAAQAACEVVNRWLSTGAMGLPHG